MKFCSNCGSADINLKIPEGDNLPRFVCAACNEIFYSNPKIVAGCIAEWEDKILMCKRAIEPRYGKWTLPAGFMENDETMHAAAARETYEEAKAKVKNIKLFALYNLPHINQVYAMFRAELVGGKASPGEESLEVELMIEQEIPWEQIAFPVIKDSLELFFEDRKNNSFTLHYGDMKRLPEFKYKVTRY